jgi:hypothetical protein
MVYFTPWLLYPQRSSPVVPRDVLYVMEKKKILEFEPHTTQQVA